jgi:hypothetical protein
MLSLEVPARQVGGVLVFADHADPNQFYYAAPNPTVAKTAGRAMFDVFSYSVELKSSPLGGTTIPAELGAGFLTMGVECVLSPAQRAQALNELASQLDLDQTKLNLAPIPYTKGTVSVIALDASSGTVASSGGAAPADGRPTFVRQIVGSGTPSLLGDLRSIFSLSLSQEGVVFLQGLYEQNAAPVGVVYDLKFLGLRPAVQAKIHADVSRIYNEFSAKASVGYPVYFRAEVEDTISKLKQQGAITIEVTTQAVGEEATKATELALALFKDKIIQELFAPAPTPKIPNLGGLTSLTTQPQSIVSLSLKLKSEEELRTIDYDFTQRAPEERTHAPQGFITTLMSEAEVKQRIHHVDLASPFFELLEVLVTGPTEEEFKELQLRSVTADLTYGKPGGQVDTESLLFRPGATGDRTWAVKRSGRPSLAYTVDLTYEFSRDGSVDGDSLTYRTGPREHTGRTLSIRPYDDLFVLDVEVELGRVPDGVRDVDVSLAYKADDFTAQQQLRLPKASVPPIEQRRWQVRTAPPARGEAPQEYTATSTLTFEDGAVLALPPVSSTERLFRVDAPFTATRQLLVQPAVTAADVSAITVEVAYEDKAAGYSRSFVRTFKPGTDAAPGWQPETLTWPIIDGSRQKLRYRVTTAAGGVVDATDWTETDEPSIVVGDVGARRRNIEVRLIGPALAEAGLDAVNVRVGVAGSADADAMSVFFDPSTPVSQSVSLPAAPGAPAGFRYQTTGFHSDGRQTQSGWIDAPNPLLVVSTRSV